MLPEIELDSRFLFQSDGTSDGTQIKYLYENRWYKIDRYGGEGVAEELASRILALSGLPEKEYVRYDRILINGSQGCVSNSFLKDSETFITLYRLHTNIIGTDPLTVTSKMEYDEAIEYMIDFTEKYAHINIRTYLANNFALDALILNEDRHFNNLGLIYDGTDYRPAPIFDNGKSLFIGNSRYDPKKTPEENRRNAFAKAFSGSFSLNFSYLSEYATLHFDFEKIIQFLKTQDLTGDNIYARLYRQILLK